MSDYPDVELTITFTSSDGDPVEGLRVDLHSGWGFVGEEVTDSDGSVTFQVTAYTTYRLWVDHSDFEEDVGCDGDDSEVEFEYDSAYKDEAWRNDDDEDGDEDSSD